MILRHDSRAPLYRDPGGALPCRARVTLRLRAPGAREVTLRLWQNGGETRLPMRASRLGDGLFEREVTAPETPGLLWYYFLADGAYYGNAPDRLGGEGAESEIEPPSYQITVYDPAFAPPAWMRDAVVYQIFPDRFFRSGKTPAAGRPHARWDELPELSVEPATGDNRADDFFGGDLPGVEEKLPYLQSLGASAIYLNPIFESPSNHKYNTTDYERVDPGFGTNADFSRLCEKAKALGIRVLLDGVFSHTGSESRYFREAVSSRESTCARWYSFSRWPDEYACWWGFKTLPCLNETEPSALRYFVNADDSIAARWLRAGASGWRLDVADELPMDFLRALRTRVKKVSAENALIGEVWEDASNKVAYGEARCYCLGDTLDSAMNYPLRAALVRFMTGEIDGHQAARLLEAQRENYPPPFYEAQMNLLGSHDMPRAITRLSGEYEPLPREKRTARPLSREGYALGAKRYLALFRFLCALPGMPSVYYGDEAGATGGDDPFNRGTYPWGVEDAALRQAVGEAARARNASLVRRRGGTRFFAPCADALAVARRAEGEALVCALNRTGAPLEIRVSPADAPELSLSAPATLEIAPFSACDFSVHIDTDVQTR